MALPQNSCIDTDSAILDHRVTNLEKTIERVSDAVASISDSLALLARIEARHEETSKAVGRAFSQLADMEKDINAMCTEKEKRLREIETKIPALEMIKTWVVTGVLGVMALAGTALFHLVFK